MESKEELNESGSMMVERVYTLGNGDVNIGMGVLHDGGAPFITVANMEKPLNIGDNTLHLETEDSNVIVIKFESIKSFNVLQKAMDKCRDELINKKK